MDTYSVQGYGAMMADELRMDAYTEALEKTGLAGKTVLDIGTGPGLMALTAARLGARHVHAVEPAGIVQLAREVVALNGYDDRITVHQARSRDIELPEKAAVIVSDMRGILPLLWDHPESIIDARTRLLAPGGRLIPERDTLWAAPVDADDCYARCVDGWEGDRRGFDMSPGRRFAVNRWIRGPVPRETLIHEPVCWAELDYHRINDADVRGQCHWRFDTPGRCNGFAVWFDTCLIDDIGFSNAPGNDFIYKNAFFPLEESVTLYPGDNLALQLEARHVGGDYIWVWRTRVTDSSGQRRFGYTQSTFRGQLLDPGALRKRKPDYIPVLSPSGRAAHDILAMMRAGEPLRTIATRVRVEHPGVFDSEQKALERVLELAQQFTD